MGILLNLGSKVLGGMWGYVAAAVITAAAAVWLTHSVDGNAMKRMELQYARQRIAQQQADAAALAKFQTQTQAANDAAAASSRAAEIQREEQIQRLSTSLQEARNADPALARCLALKLPRGVLDSLAH